MFNMTRKQWFLFAPDKGAEGGEPSEKGDKVVDDKIIDDDFLDINKDKKEDISDEDDSEGLMSTRSKKKDAQSDDEDDTPDGERPSNIPEKFWDAEKKAIRVANLADSYKESESALSRLRGENKVPESPEGYLEVFTFDTEGQMRYGEGIDRLPTVSKDDPLLMAAFESFHRRGLSIEQAAGVIKDIFSKMDGLYPESFDNEAYVEEQNEILGKNFEVQVDTAIDWVKSLHSQGVLNLNEARALHREVGKSAHGVMALNKLRAEITGEAVIPVHEVLPEDGLPTPQELYAMKLTSKYKDDPEYRQKVDALFPKVFPGTGKANVAGLGMAAIQANDARKRQKK